MVRLRMTIPRRPGTAGFLNVEMNVYDDNEAVTIGRALAYICEADVGLETDSGLYQQIRYAEIHKSQAMGPKPVETPPWEE